MVGRMKYSYFSRNAWKRRHIWAVGNLGMSDVVAGEFHAFSISPLSVSLKASGCCCNCAP